jgi:hypothetical protein
MSVLDGVEMPFGHVLDKSFRRNTFVCLMSVVAAAAAVDDKNEALASASAGREVRVLHVEVGLRTLTNTKIITIAESISGISLGNGNQGRN